MKAYHTSQFSTLSSQLSSCPQIYTDFLRLLMTQTDRLIINFQLPLAMIVTTRSIKQAC